MSYSAFDLVSDELFDAIGAREARDLYSHPDKEEDRLLDQELDRRIFELWAAVDFLKAHPELGGKSARDPKELAQARHVFAPLS